MKTYVENINELHEQCIKDLDGALTRLLYRTLHQQISDITVDINGEGVCTYNKNVVRIHIEPHFVKYDLSSVTIVSDSIPELNQPLELDFDTDLDKAYVNYVTSYHTKESVANAPHVECLYKTLGDDPVVIEDVADESNITDDEYIQTVIDRANQSSGHIESWYILRKISKHVMGGNCFILIKPGFDYNYTAYVLPLQWLFKLRVKEIDTELISPVLLEAWYDVETGRKPHACISVP